MEEIPAPPALRLASHDQPRALRVKNKYPASIQITAEHILREARQVLQQQEESKLAARSLKRHLLDTDELADYQSSRRKEFEDRIRRADPHNIRVWINYATWEVQHRDLRRARSVFERALDVNSRNPATWITYANMEVKQGCIQHARSVWDRAVFVLPCEDRLWYKYIHMEQMLGNYSAVRCIFQRWAAACHSNPYAWSAYAKFELQRCGQIEAARKIYDSYVVAVPTVQAWIEYAKFEVKNGEVGLARRCYERALEHLGEDGHTQEFFIAFAQFEERFKEIERARCIYRYALQRMPREQASGLYRSFLHFEKRYGNPEQVEDALSREKRSQYEEQLRKGACSYDVWFDYVKLEENGGDIERIREVYERAIAHTPPAQEKHYWRRYIYLWIKYALFEELEAEDMERTRDIYRRCLNCIPHQTFSFAKIWLLAAQFEIRQKNMKAARRVLGNALGMAPKDKIYRTYIEIELQLGNINRCRILYAKYLEWAPANCHIWRNFVDLERSLGEKERARTLFELAVQQPILHMPELLWKSYIEFEISEGEMERTRQLYERLLDRTKHLKVWLSYAKFEASVFGSTKAAAHVDIYGKQCLLRSRAIFQRAFDYLRTDVPNEKEESVTLLKEWREMERSFCELGDVTAVDMKMPRRAKRRHIVVNDCGGLARDEEYMDYLFSEEGEAQQNLKILEAAYRWKRQKGV